MSLCLPCPRLLRLFSCSLGSILVAFKLTGYYMPSHP